MIITSFKDRLRFTMPAKSVVSVVLCCGCLAAQTTRPERIVNGSVITSVNNPKVRIELPKSVQYVGADRWILYDIADCELHAFVETGVSQRVERLYWVQFEGYVPSKPELKHTYNSPRHASLGGMNFYVDTWVRGHNAETPPGSDIEHIQKLIRSHGYNMPDGMMSVRLVHLLDEQKRKELMIIYSEDVALSGLTAADLQKGGKAFERWPTLETELVERAKRNVKIDWLDKR